MSLTWEPDEPLRLRPVGAAGGVRAVSRGAPLVLLLALGLLLLLLLRLLERPLHGQRRPWTPWITVAVCRGALRLLGLRVGRRGPRLVRRGAVVANHSSWLDILALGSLGPLVFVSKAEVAGWPGIGWLARATGTIFVRRDRRGDVGRQVAQVRERIERGELVCLFPEGTSSDGRRVLPFKPALLAALPPEALVQAVSLAWEAPEDEDPRFYGWFGGAAFGSHAWAVLGARRHGGVTMRRHAPLVAGTNRKALAREAEGLVRDALRVSSSPRRAP